MSDLSTTTLEKRNAYVSDHLKAFIANQIRSLRGKRSQSAFSKIVDKPQAVISRLENPEYGKANLQTLLDIACKLDMALIVGFVSYATFDEIINKRAWASITTSGITTERIVHGELLQFGNYMPKVAPVTFSTTGTNITSVIK